MNLLIQPDDGIEPLLSGIRSAKKSIEIVIFRFDRAELEAGLKAAVARGVSVSALIAYTNRGGEINLRKLEMRLLEVGVTVSRTANDLVRYHDKMMIIDRRLLYVLSFNFTHLDIDHSRGFGLVTRKVRFVHEAVKLFEADSARQPYAPSLDSFIVSPANARKLLAAFIRKARRQLLIYDPLIADTEMLRALSGRTRAGVEIKVIGRVSKPTLGLEVRNLAGLRLHTRTIIRDRRQAFVGSQSLRRAELDSRREVGVIVHEPDAVNRLIQTFEADWERKE
ncbi:MAG: phospholipase D-like domain-containing protein, partial [Bryobacteraceae bacterium]